MGPSCRLATVTTVVVGQIFAGGTLGCPRLEGASAIRPGVQKLESLSWTLAGQAR